MVFLSEQVLICIWREIRRIIYKHYIFLFLILFSWIIYFLFEFLYFLNSFLFIKTFIIFGFLKTITSIFFISINIIILYSRLNYYFHSSVWLVLISFLFKMKCFVLFSLDLSLLSYIFFNLMLQYVTISFINGIIWNIYLIFY